MADFKFKANSFTFTERDGVLVTLRDGVLVERRWDASDPEAVGRISEVTSYDPVTGLEIETRTAYSGGFVDIASPVPETGSVRTFVDYGSEAWATRTEYLTRSWASGPLKLTYREDVQDHGGSVASYFADGRLARVREADAGNTRAWTERVTFYSGVHDREVVVTLGDDGVQVEQVFLDQGTRITRETGRDWADVFDWRNYSIHFSDTGASTHTRHFDNGIYQLRYEQDGMPILESQQDREDVRSWDSWLKEYDSEGRIERYQISFDDGIVQTRTYEEGRHFATNWRDAFDARWWSERGVTYGPDGEIVSEMLLRDDGIRFETTYLADNTVIVTEDTSDIRDWSSRVETLSADGTERFEVETADDGTVSRTLSEDGRVVWSDDLDLRDRQDWLYVYRRHDAETGAVLSETTVSDEGRIETVLLGEGTPAAVGFVDDSDAQDWQVRWIDLDQLTGKALRAFTLTDGGIARTDRYVDGVLSVVLEVDASTDAEFISRWSDYVDGVLEQVWTTFPDGDLRGEQYYANGTLRTVAETDVVDGQPVAFWQKSFDEIGALTEWIFLNEDGTWQTRSYSAGVHRSTTWSDFDDIQWWSEKSVTYDAPGEVVSDMILRDDGIRITTQHRDSERVVLYEDEHDIRDWLHRVEVFDRQSNALLHRSVSRDDGLVTEQRYADGRLSVVTQQDVGGLFDWARTQTEYDEDGDVISFQETSDDGILWTSYYDAGVLHEKQTIDIADSFDWHMRIRTYVPEYRFRQISDEEWAHGGNGGGPQPPDELLDPDVTGAGTPPYVGSYDLI